MKGLTHLDKEDADVVHNLDPHCLVRVRHLPDGHGDGVRNLADSLVMLVVMVINIMMQSS